MKFKYKFIIIIVVTVPIIKKPISSNTYALDI